MTLSSCWRALFICDAPQIFRLAHRMSWSTLAAFLLRDDGQLQATRFDSGLKKSDSTLQNVIGMEFVPMTSSNSEKVIHPRAPMT
jgi:hypothetical protein